MSEHDSESAMQYGDKSENDSIGSNAPANSRDYWQAAAEYYDNRDD